MQNTPIGTTHYSDKFLNTASAVSWGAIFAGALAACALSLIMFILGSGLGFSVVSPWSAYGMSTENLGLSAILWITFTQLLASGVGGYIAGRLRVKWLHTHIDEIFFRDTVHGFLAWAIATFFMVTLVSSSLETLVKGGIHATGTAINTTSHALSGTAGILLQTGTTIASQTDPKKDIQYWIDTLFRKGRNVNDKKSENHGFYELNSQSIKRASEVTRIFMNAIYHQKELSEKDLDYVTDLISAQTEIGREEAQKRVRDTYSTLLSNLHEVETAAKKAIDKSRKAMVYASLWTTVSLLVGAFIASLTASWGGRHRENI